MAVLLSGGVDSTLLAKALVDRGLEVTGYCVRQPEASDVQLVKRLARTLGLSVRVTELTPELVAAELPEIIRAIEMNGPVQVGAAIPMYLATKAAARDGHRVLYSGQAADELFAGYDWYREVLQREGPLALHARLWEDIDALYVDTLEREDRTSMAHSVELRAPFLDRDLLRVAMRMDPRLKLPDARAEGKWIHRRLAASVVCRNGLLLEPRCEPRMGPLWATCWRRSPGETCAVRCPASGKCCATMAATIATASIRTAVRPLPVCSIR
nr:asparagine synthase-related protein [Rhodothermus marinus]